jgi:hypothetical protein
MADEENVPNPEDFGQFLRDANWVVPRLPIVEHVVEEVVVKECLTKDSEL